MFRDLKVLPVRNKMVVNNVMRKKQYLKELKRQNIYDENRMEQYEATEYYFENGLRKVYPYHFTFTTCVQEKWTGRPILEVFVEQFQSNTEENYRKAIEEGHLRVNGNDVAVDYCLKPNDIIVSRIHRHENPVADEKVEIIYEDKDVLVVNKPASIPCQPCGRYRFNCMVFILCKELGLPCIRNIYRLDWQTSGVMVCGKTKEKAMILEHQIQNGFVTKEYVCRVEGEFPLGVVTLDRPIVCVSHRLFLWKVMPNGKPSKTVFERLSFNGKSSVVKCIPQEVRTAHHIRVHLQFLGHPILNDPVYNSEVWGPTKGKAGVYSRPDEEVIKDVDAIHRVGMWREDRNPILDLKLELEKSSSQLTENTSKSCCCCCNSSTSSSKIVDSEHETPSNCVLNEEDDRHESNDCSDESGLTCEDAQRITGNHIQPSSSDIVNKCSPSPSLVLDVSRSPPDQSDSVISDLSVSERSVNVSESVQDDSVLAKSSCCVGDVENCQCQREQSEQSTATLSAQNSDCIEDRAAVSVKNTALHDTDSDDPYIGPSHKRIRIDSNGTHTSSTVISPTQRVCQSHDTTSQSESAQTSESPSETSAPSHPGFDINKWIPDPHCAECTKTYIDPNPAKLMIYLHALRYKGPGWEYSTKLPEWAEEDWKGE